MSSTRSFRKILDTIAKQIQLTPCNSGKTVRHHAGCGGVAERLNAAVLKTVELARVPGVRIPPPPPLYDSKPLK